MAFSAPFRWIVSCNIVVTDIRMPFWSMVFFMVKWAIAAIPAILILTLLGAALAALLTGWFATSTHKIVRLESNPPAITAPV